VQRRQFVSYAATALAAPAFVRNALAQEGGISGKSLTIGCSAALSGPLAGFGTDLRQGAEAAIAQINARGGVNGRALQLHMVDDGYVPQRTIDNVKQMIGQGSAFALLSCVGTPNNTAILPVVEEAGMPYVAPLTGASSLRKNARNVFHVRASYTDEVQRLVQRLVGMGVKEIGVVFLDNPYGRELLEDANRAEVLLEASEDSRRRRVVASTSAGQVRECQLRLRFDYLVRTAEGELLVPKVELRLVRDMNYTETAALPKEQEAANLYGAMHSDAVAQVMRRLAAVTAP